MTSQIRRAGLAYIAACFTLAGCANQTIPGTNHPDQQHIDNTGACAQLARESWPAVKDRLSMTEDMLHSNERLFIIDETMKAVADNLVSESEIPQVWNDNLRGAIDGVVMNKIPRANVLTRNMVKDRVINSIVSSLELDNACVLVNNPTKTLADEVDSLATRLENQEKQ